MLQNSTECKCGCNLKNAKFEHYIPQKLDDKFYGGIISMTAELKCECGRKIKGYFKTVVNKYELVDTEIIAENNTNETINEVAEENKKEDDFEKMLYKDLQALAKEKGIEKINLKKDELIELIRQTI